MLDVEPAFPLVIALGPEGGVMDDEREEMIEGGFTPVRLASTTLRFETAGIAALAIARALAESTIRESVS
jgi:RsmE family RNA methyltransferase